MLKLNKDLLETLKDYMDAGAIRVDFLPPPGTPSFELLSLGCLMITGSLGGVFIRATRLGGMTYRANTEKNEVAA